MTDETGAAPAAAESISAPAPEPVVSTPNPISTEPQTAPDVKAEPKPVSAREALQKAAEKVEKADKPDPTDKVPPVKSEGATRDDKGKFASKDAPDPQKAAAEPAKAETAPKAPATPPEPASDAPARFSPDAKVAWSTAPEPVKAEVNRAIREMEAGIEKHRASAEAFEPIRKYHDMAKQGGTTLDAALERYTNIENMLQAAPIRGLEEICRNLGVSLRDVAAHVMGQTPDQTASAQDATIRELRAELAQIKEQVGGVTQTFQKQQQEGVERSVAEFAASKPRFDELADDIAFFLKSGRTTDLSEAYQLAERLNPAPASAPQPEAIASAPDLTAQTLKGSKSVTGAPSPGSNPAHRQPSSSIKDSLRRAVAQAG